MRTVLMAEFDNAREAKAASALLNKFGKNVKLMEEKFWEDMYLAKMIEEGIKDKRKAPVIEIHTKLRK